MKLPWKRQETVPLPDAVRAAVTADGEKVLGHAPERGRSRWLVATGRRVWALDADGTVLRSTPWVEVDSAFWQPSTTTLTIQCSSSYRPEQWSLEETTSSFTEALHERVTRSVVLAVDLEHDGRPIGRAAIRRDPETNELIPQLAWARGVQPKDPERLAYGDAVLANLCDQVGIQPPRREA